MNYQLAIWTALVSFLVVAPWIYTLTQENKRLRGKYRICSEERTKLAGELMEVRDVVTSIQRRRDDMIAEYKSQYDNLLAQTLETESVNDVLRKQSECYRISRDQARDDIEGIKRNIASMNNPSVWDFALSDIGKKLLDGEPAIRPKELVVREEKSKYQSPAVPKATPATQRGRGRKPRGS